MHRSEDVTAPLSRMHVQSVIPHCAPDSSETRRWVSPHVHFRNPRYRLGSSGEAFLLYFLNDIVYLIYRFRRIPEESFMVCVMLSCPSPLPSLTCHVRLPHNISEASPSLRRWCLPCESLALQMGSRQLLVNLISLWTSRRTLLESPLRFSNIQDQFSLKIPKSSALLSQRQHGLQLRLPTLTQ